MLCDYVWVARIFAHFVLGALWDVSSVHHLRLGAFSTCGVRCRQANGSTQALPRPQTSQQPAPQYANVASTADRNLCFFCFLFGLFFVRPLKAQPGRPVSE